MPPQKASSSFADDLAAIRGSQRPAPPAADSFAADLLAVRTQPPRVPAPPAPPPAPGPDVLSALSKATAITAEPAPASFLGRVRDLGVTALKGAIALPESLVGLADIPTGGRVGKALESVGFQPNTAREILDRFYTEQQQRANRSVADADGVLDTVAAAVKNPSTILHAVVESAPLMLGGAGVARGFVKAGVPLVAAAAAGEGAVTAGSMAEQLRGESDTGTLTPKQAVLSVAAGVGTGSLGAFGAKVAKSLGIADVDTLLAAGVRDEATRKTLVKGVVYGAVQEGFFEELPQSVQEQVLQNVAAEKPWDEGVDTAAVMGALAGAVMGGGSQVAARALPTRADAPAVAPPAETSEAAANIETFAADLAAVREAPAAPTPPPTVEAPPSSPAVEAPVASPVAAAGDLSIEERNARARAEAAAEPPAAQDSTAITAGRELERRVAAGVSQSGASAESDAQETAEPPRIPVRRLTNLSDRERQIESRAAAALEADADGFVDRYRRAYGTVINADNASELFEEYASSPDARAENVRAVRGPAASLADEVYRRALTEPVPRNKARLVVFTSGGNGVGKSSAIATGARPPAIVFDSTLSQLEPSVANIERALDAGFDVDIVHVQRDPVNALTGALSRAAGEGQGRTVSLRGLAQTHRGAAAVLGQLADRYANDQRVEFRAFDNVEGEGLRHVELQAARQRAYPTDDVLAPRLRAALDDEYRAGRVSDAVYRGIAGEDPSDAARGDRPDVRGDGGTVARAVPDESGAERELGEGAGATRDTSNYRVAASLPTGFESARQQEARRTSHVRDVWKAVLARAKQVDPAVNPRALRKEFDARLAIIDDLDREFRESGHNPRTLLEAIAKAGGLSIDTEEGGGYSGELRWLRERREPYGNFAGVPKVFQKRTTDARGKTVTGHGLDDMVRYLSQEPEFAHIEDIPDLFAALEDIARRGDVGARGAVYPGTRELTERAGMRPDEAWWRDSWQQQEQPTEPEPLTAESYQRAFGGTKEQAEALVQVIEAMGIPRDRVFVTKGEGGAHVLYQDASEPAPIFYSRILQVVVEKMPKRAPASQILQIVSNPKNGVKAEELQWSGLKLWLDQRVVATKADVVAFLFANQIQVSEVLLGEATPSNEAQAAVAKANDALKAYLLSGEKGFTPTGLSDYLLEAARGELSPSQIDAARHDPEHWRLVTELQNAYDRRAYLGGLAQPTKFGAHTLPGGENYRELLLMLPARRQWVSGAPVTAEDLATQHGREAADRVASYSDDVFTGGHFDEPNVLAHIRFNDRTDAQGRKVLFVEEVQSDWHQQGRRKGYKSAPRDTAGWKAHQPITTGPDRGLWPVYDADGKYVTAVPAATATEAINAAAGLTYGVPDAPFKTTWPELAMKRMLRYAAEHGYDVLAWTTGEQQNERYDLSKQVKKVTLFKNHEGTLMIQASATVGGMALELTPLGEKSVEDFIGKDPATKLDAQEWRSSGAGKGWSEKSIEGVDLKVGGSGMRGFYDDILPRFMDRYGRAWGVRTQDVTINDENVVAENPERPGRRLDLTPAKVHGIVLTDTARKAALQGQPLFQGPRASVEFTDHGEAVIRALKNPNVSSGLHEIAHVARRFFFDRSLPPDVREGITDDDILTAEEWAGAIDGVWSREAEEKFARGFERYFYDGDAPSDTLRTLFEKFSRWLAKVYQGLTGSPIDVAMTPAMRQVFDRLVTRTERLRSAEATGDDSFDVEALEAELSELPDGERELEQADTPAPHVVRSRPTGTLVFDRPITGPSQASLVSYRWHHQLVDDVDARGEDAVRRVSDWNEAVENAETGRDVVHEFTVRYPDGRSQSVSLESALRELGFLDREADGAKRIASIGTTLKTRAKLAMELAQLTAADADYQARLDKAYAKVDKLAVPDVTTESYLERSQRFRRGDAWVIQHTQGPIDEERQRTLDEQWRTKRVAELIPLERSRTADIVSLQDRIARLDRKLQVRGPVLYQDEPSPEYQAALRASRDASAAFTEATRRYRAREIGDKEFLAARKAHQKAGAAFDEAYAKEQRSSRQRPAVSRATDLFDTGEEQPRLPGAEDVREQNIETPAFDAPFSLTAPVNRSAKGRQDRLFQDGDGRARRGKQLTLEALATVAKRRKATLETVRRVAEQAGYLVVDESPRPARAESTTVVPPQEPIPAARLREFPSLQKMPAAIREDIADMLQRYQGFEAQRRGVQPIARTQALAKDVWLPLETLRPGTALNAEELEAYKTAVATALTERQIVLDKIKDGSASDWDRLQFSHLTDVATVLTASYRGAKAEAGRALNVLRVKARVLDLQESKFLEAALRAPGFQHDLTRVSKASLEAVGDPLKQLRILRQRSGTLFDYAQAAYYTNLLSGVKTHLRNLIGNSFNVLANTITPVGAVAADIVRSRKSGDERTVYFGEIPRAVVGGFIGVQQGLKNAAFTFREGFRPSTVTAAEGGTFDSPRVELTIPDIAIAKIPALERAREPFERVANWPSRALEAADEFFRAIAFHQELYAGAYVEARNEGLTAPGALSARMAEILAATDRTSDDGKVYARLRERADAFAARAVFQEEPGAIVQWLLKAKSRTAPIYMRTLALFLSPFIKTPAAILRQGAEWSPAGLVMRGAKQEGREGSQALGRAALGTGFILAPIAWLAATGRLTGAPPEDPGDREEFYAQGKLANAVRIGDYWVRYSLFQPFSVPMAAVANAWERFNASDKDEGAAEEAFLAAIAGAGASLLDQSFLAGLGTFIDAVNDPTRYAGQWLNLFSQGFVPYSGLLRNVTQAVDPVYRRPEGVAESVQSIIPGASSGIRPRRTRFGEEARRPGNAVTRGFVVPEVSKAVEDTVTATLARLKVQPTTPRAQFTLRGQPVALTPGQQDAVIEAVGRERKLAVERIIAAPWFGQGSDEAQRAQLERAIAGATDRVRPRVLQALAMKTPLTVDALVSPVVRDQLRRDQAALFGEGTDAVAR